MQSYTKTILSHIAGLAACVAVLIGCSGPEPSSEAGGGAARIDSDCKDGVLHISLVNTGHKPIVVDRDLVFAVEIRATAADGQPLALTEYGICTKPLEGFRPRFVTLRPGEEVTRTVELRSGWVMFSHGVGSPLSQEPRAQRLSAYEARYTLSEGLAPAAIQVIYGSSFAFPECFEQYTELKASELGLYEGPLQTTVPCE